MIFEFFTLDTLGRERILIHFPRKRKKEMCVDGPLHGEKKIEIEMVPPLWKRKANSKLWKGKRQKEKEEIIHFRKSNHCLVGVSFTVVALESTTDKKSAEIPTTTFYPIYSFLISFLIQIRIVLKAKVVCVSDILSEILMLIMLDWDCVHVNDKG